jgi:hypothetical protein
MDAYREKVGNRIGIYYISEQAYCEKRVALWLGGPGDRVQIPASLTRTRDPIVRSVVRQADFGIEAHAVLESQTPVAGPGELRKVVRLPGTHALAEVSLTATYRGLPLIGRPDIIFVGDRRASVLVDLKITPSDQRQRSHVTQLQLYGYLLEEEGIGCSDLLLCVVLVPPQPLAADKLDVLHGLTERDIMALHRRIVGLRDSDPKRSSWSAFKVPLRRGLLVTLRAFPYDRRIATEGELNYFREFWRGSRQAKASTNIEKCRRCLYNRARLCDDAIGPFRP